MIEKARSILTNTATLLANAIIVVAIKVFMIRLLKS